MRTFTLRIDGMDCAACAAQLKEELLRNRFICDAGISYADGRVLLTCEDDVSLETICRTVKRAGFAVTLEEVPVESDADAVQLAEALQDVFGVKDVISEQNGKTIRLYPVEVSLNHLQAVLRKAHIEAHFGKKRGSDQDVSDITQIRLLKQLILAVFLTMPLFWQPAPMIQMILSSLVQFGPGFLFYRGAYRSLHSHRANMDLLIAISTSAIYFYSVWIVFTVKEDIQLYFMAQCVLVDLLLFGRYLEQMVRGETIRSLHHLLQLQPETAHIIGREGVKEVMLEEVKAEDRILVRAGERIPVDGVVKQGHGIVNESMLTGESRPVEKKAEDTVIGGTLCTDGSFEVEMTASPDTSVLQQIIAQVRTAQMASTPMQDKADQIAAVAIPVILVIALCTFLAWYLYFDAGNLTRAIMNGAGVLVAACPCALGLAVPTSMMTAMSRSAENGLLFRDSSMMETVCQTRAVVFDKTGTLTTGMMHVEDIHTYGDMTEEELLRMAASLEQYAVHPLSRAVIQAAAERHLTLYTLKNMTEMPGYGLAGMIRRHQIQIGSSAYMHNLRIPVGEEDRDIYLAVDGRCAGSFRMADTVRPEAADVMRRLKERGIAVIMITGDRRETAAGMAAKLGISRYEAEVKPSEKADRVRQLRKEYGMIAMVGDGINDAPALAEADCSFAMGKGTDIAKETAGIMLLKDSLYGLLDALTISAAARANIRGNFIWALVYNAAVIPLAAAGIINPSIASAAMSASSIAVLLHALKLRRVKLEAGKESA